MNGGSTPSIVNAGMGIQLPTKNACNSAQPRDRSMVDGEVFGHIPGAFTVGQPRPRGTLLVGRELWVCGPYAGLPQLPAGGLPASVLRSVCALARPSLRKAPKGPDPLVW